MSDSLRATNLAVSSNVYYLPVPSAADVAPRRTRWARLKRAWWRVRFAIAGMRLALRPAPAPLFAEDDTLAILQGRAELIERRRVRTRPARVIDFDAARARRRPAAAP